MKVRTMKGAILDFAQALAQNENSIAIGNAKMNAKGDILGPGGKVVKSREQIAREYHTANPKAVRKISLKDLEPDSFLSPSEAVAQAREAAKPKKAGRIVDSDK